MHTANPLHLDALSVTTLKGVGDQLAEKLKRLGIYTIQDVLFHFPSRYQDRTKVESIASLTAEKDVVIEGVIENVSEPKTGKTTLLCEFEDDTGGIFLRFFHVFPQQKNLLKKGARLRLYGETRKGMHGLEIYHPEFIVLGEAPIPEEKTLTPTYPTTEGVSQFLLKKITGEALQLLQQSHFLETNLIADITLPSLKEAILFLHRPPQPTDMLQLANKTTPQQKRIIFEELLAHRLGLLHAKKSLQTHDAYTFTHETDLKLRFLKNLAFELTNAQQKVIADIEKDLARPFPMVRLLQGDVGSGKTVVSAIAMLRAIENGYQVALMAPTEILADQHHQQFIKWFAPLNIQVDFLSGSVSAAIRKKILSEIESGEAKIIIGTHALFQEKVTFSKLGMIVIDEQHRFGVAQRASFREKGMMGTHAPHQLVMTATPIPRTLAMSYYADLDLSVISELPKGRVPIKTTLLDQSKRKEVIERIRAACVSGRQVYWVCPLIEESDKLQAESAENTLQLLKKMLPELKIDMVHGRMTAAEKEAVMLRFKHNESHVLVATTVIEVGVDVPNASVMIIENAERLGLSQLHQLRGRVGRGNIASFCLLLYQPPLSLISKERLSIIRDSTDGFYIAERDLEIRGPGEVLGTKQTGDIVFRLADFMRDRYLFPDVARVADVLIQTDPEKARSIIARWMGHRVKYKKV